MSSSLLDCHGCIEQFGGDAICSKKINDFLVAGFDFLACPSFATNFATFFSLGEPFAASRLNSTNCRLHHHYFAFIHICRDLRNKTFIRLADQHIPIDIPYGLVRARRHLLGCRHVPEEFNPLLLGRIALLRNILGQVDYNISFFGVNRQGLPLSQIRVPEKAEFLAVIPAEYSSMRSRKSSCQARCISMSMNRPSRVRACMSKRVIFFPFFGVRRCTVGLRCVTETISRLPFSRRMAFKKWMRFFFFLKILLKTGSYVGSKPQPNPREQPGMISTGTGTQWP